MNLMALGRCAWLCAALLAASPVARAADAFPSKPIRVVNPYAAGGAVDVLTRILTEKMATSMGATFVIEAKPGGAGNIGTDAVARAPADGYTWLIATTSNAANAALMPDLHTDLLRDLTPVAQFATSPNYFVVPASLSVNSIREYVALARSKPGQLSYGSAGIGSTPHLGFERLKQVAGIDVVAIPYKGAPSIVTDLASGRLSAAFLPAVLTLAHAKSGKFKVLAITDSKRSKDFPDVPTMAEAGLGDAVVAPWFAVLVPRGTPPALISRIEGTIRDAVASPDVASRFQAAGAVPVFQTGTQTRAMIRQEISRWQELAKTTSLKAN